MIRSIRSIEPLPLVLAALLTALPAQAQSPGDRAAAEAVFREGRDLMDKGAYQEACPKFEKSLALYQSASAALNLARCYGKTNRLAAAMTTLERAEELNRLREEGARKSELDELAATTKKEIAPRVPHVRVVVKPAVSGTVVERNGIRLPEPLVGAPIPVDPGTYEIKVRAPGYGEVVRSQTIDEGQSVVVEVTLERSGTSAAKPSAMAPGKPAADTQPAPLVWPWVMLGGGVASLSVAVGFGVDYAMARSDLDALCPGGTCPTGSEDEARDLTARWDRDVGLIAGGASLGAALLVTFGVGLHLESEARATATRVRTTWQAIPLAVPGGAGFAVRHDF